MVIPLQKASIASRHEHLFNVISGSRFLKMEGIGKEVPFFIVPYCPSEHLEMDQISGQLVNKLQHKGIRVLHLNLYDIAKELIEEKGDWTYWIEEESNTPKSQLLEELQGLTDTERKLVPAVVHKIRDADFDVLFLSGVGEVYPYIRSHSVLTNLQKVFKSHPLVMFFPGDYSYSLENGASLELFGRIHDDKYYRAFNIFEREA
jgi:hypothetical protein